jgi:polyhydroxybutyrate depolymerase
MKLPRLLLLFISLLFIAGACLKKDDDPNVDNVYRFEETITVDGRARTYILNLPPTYYDAADFSLVIALHGGGGDALQFESTSKLTDKANESNFIIVYPNGVKSTGILGAQTWNAGKCCDYARDNNINDVKFISEVIDELLNHYKINPKRVYATGHSNGGMLSYRLACEIPAKITAIAPNGCTMVVKQPCSPSRAVPVLHMHSVLDTRVPYQGGVGVTGVYFSPIDSVLNVWSISSDCKTIAQVLQDDDDFKFTKWSSCNDDVAVEYYLTQDGGHGWPGGLPGSVNGDAPSKVINANDLLWEFFQRFELP